MICLESFVTPKNMWIFEWGQKAIGPQKYKKWKKNQEKNWKFFFENNWSEPQKSWAYSETVI